MAGVVYYCAATLDGFIADARDRVDWLTTYRGSYDGAHAEPIEGAYESFYRGVGALVFGSATYEFVLDRTTSGADWPYAHKPCWVLSSRELRVPSGHGVDVRLVNAPVDALFPELAASAGERSLWIVGGGNVASQFADAGLIDEVRLHVVPAVLGRGKPLFERPLPDPLTLSGAIPRDNGMVELRYHVHH